MNHSATHGRHMAPSRTARWIFLVTLLLLAWWLRLVYLETVPPGWRDDELINIHALSGELLKGRFPLYFTGASGHEPLYHYLHAGLHATLGHNVLSGHLLSVYLGTLTIALTYVLIRRLFGLPIAALTSLALTTSFWSLMYSRTAIRHISLLPFALAAFYLLWVPLTSGSVPARRGLAALRHSSNLRWALPLGLMLGLSLYTYPVARLLPIVLLCFALYLALLHRDLFRRVWAGYALALVIMAALALPLALVIAQGSGEAAAQGIGADARLVELARPVRALRDGDPGPLLESLWTTLNMFHATGDPEALYNIPDRPVFNLIGGFLFWIGVLLCLFRWREPRYLFLILWLGFGLLPTVLSVPPASLSHSILVQPLAYLLLSLVLVEGYQWVRRRFAPGLNVASSVPLLVAVLLIVLVPVVFRDLWDYFRRWPNDSYVRFLYRADYRDAAQYLDKESGTPDWAVGSLLMGPWDRLALDVDTHRDDAVVRLFDPQRAMVFVGEASPGSTLLTSYPPASPSFEHLLRDPVFSAPAFRRFVIESPPIFNQEPLARFTNGLELVAIAREEDTRLVPGQEATLLTAWSVAEPLQMPPVPVVANPPPPGVYAGPRLAVFAHVLASDGSLIMADDGLWVDPVTLRPGDRFLQAHRFTLPKDALAGPYSLELGLYDPLTGERWTIETPDAVLDRLIFPISDP